VTAKVGVELEAVEVVMALLDAAFLKRMRGLVTAPEEAAAMLSVAALVLMV
jgi:hypothetical protein